MNRVIDFIDVHLAEVEPLRLEAIASVAAFSPFHFHRIFRSWTGETLQDFIRHRRLDKAAGQLAHNPALTIQSIGLHCGFSSAEAFSRAFAQHFGMSPSAWRAGGYRYWDPVLGQVCDAGADSGVEVRIRVEPVREVVYFRVAGDYLRTCGQAWSRCLEWAERHGLQEQPLLGMALDDPQITPPDRCRYDACVQLPEQWDARGERVSRKRIGGGVYACFDYAGSRAGVGEAWLSMLSEWLPNSGRALGEGPFFEFYRSGVCADSEAVAVELFMPLSE
jgi:AraC family transcriptional regulator